MFMTCRSGLQNNPTDEKRTRNAFDSWLKRAISEWNQNFNGVAKTRVRVTPRVRVRVEDEGGGKGKGKDEGKGKG